MELKGIDLSFSNDNVSWNGIKQEGFDFCIIRCGYGIEHPAQIDKQFENNYKGAKSIGLPVGVFHYSYATTAKEAEKEAEFCLKLLRGKQFEYPIFFDIEEKRQVNLSKQVCSDMVRAFCGKLEQAGYWAGVYSFDSFFGTNLSDDIPQRYTTWVARVDGKKPIYCKRYDMWQHSWIGKVQGVKTNVDLDICYVDYPKYIKQQRKNGFGNEPLYDVSAIKENMTLSQAKSLESKLKSLGMNVTINNA